LAAIAKPDVVKGRRIRLMFQDEARFGRMVRIRKCWAMVPERPVVNNGYEREFVYVYGAGQSASRRPGLDDLSADEHIAHERIPQPGE